MQRTEDNEEDMNISHSSIDKLVFGDENNSSLVGGWWWNKQKLAESNSASDKSYDSIKQLTWEHMLKQFTDEDKQLSEKKKVQIKEKRRPKIWDHSSPRIDQQDILIRVDDPSISSKNWVSTIKKMQLKGIENASNCGISDASNMNRV